ncbi:MAG: HD domain-containing protein [Eubacteriales bacterium]|nr:HD domain-containing protein [Eubacteriales bacterium]
MDRLERQLSFLMEIDRQKEIIRQTYLADGSRKETDAEHAWHMAVMCAVLSEYANEPIDVARTVLMLLTHDLVEIDAGDTYAYDTEGNATKRERELKAAERIYGLLPEDQSGYFRELWDEFEAMETAEAKFANMLDKIQPVLLTDAAKGKSWTEHGVRKEQIIERNARTHEGSELLWERIRQIIEKNVEAGFIRGEGSGEQPSPL